VSTAFSAPKTIVEEKVLHLLLKIALYLLLTILPAFPRAANPSLRGVLLAAPPKIVQTVNNSGSGQESESDLNAVTTNTPTWACIRQRESQDNYREPGGGAYQFINSTWTAITGLQPPAQDYSPSTQNAAALSEYQYAQKVWGNGFEPWSTAPLCGV